jgi:hypothetical protein
MMKSIALLVTTVAVLSPVPASADSWYPQNCNFLDFCAAVESIAWAAPVTGVAPRLMIASRYGQAAVHRNFSVHESKDGRTHVCMRYDPFGDLEVTCLVVPIRGF